MVDIATLTGAAIAALSHFAAAVMTPSDALWAELDRAACAVSDTPWAHVDIPGTAWGVNHIPYWSPNHATGYGVRLLCEWVEG